MLNFRYHIEVYNFVKITLISLVALLSWGCIADEVDKQNSIVIVKLSSPTLFSSITLINKQNDSYNLTSKNQFGISRYFLGEIPKGVYRISEMSTSWNFKIKTNTGFDIKIESGNLVDLGMLIYTPTKKGKAILAHTQNNEFNNFLKSAYFRNSHPQKLKQRLEWKPKKSLYDIKIPSGNTGFGIIPDLIQNHLDKSRKNTFGALSEKVTAPDEFIKNLKSHSPPSTNGVKVDSEGIAFGTQYGQIKYSDETGKIRISDTGALQSISVVYESEGAIYAGTEEGNIYVKKIGSKSWNIAFSFDTNEIVSGLANRDGTWYVATSTPNRIGKNIHQVIKFYKSKKNLDSLELERVFSGNKFKYDYGIVGSPKLNLIVGKNHLFFDMPPNQIQRYSYESKQWIDVSPSPNITKFDASKSGKNLLAQETKGRRYLLYYSSNSGKSWKKIKHPPSFTSDIFFTEENGVMATIIKKRNFIIFQYEPKKEKWLKVGKVKFDPECKNILKDEDSLSFFCVTKTGIFKPIWNRE